MSRKLRNRTLTVLATALFALFLNWAPGNLNGYMLRILNLIAINAILGLSLNLRLLVVCHCYREKSNTIRIISARKATKPEARQY